MSKTMLEKAGPALCLLCTVLGILPVALWTVEDPPRSLGGCRCYFCGNYTRYSSSCSRQERHPPVYLQHLCFRSSGFIQWDKLLRTETERVVTWKFLDKQYIYGTRYENRVIMSNDVNRSNASITIDQLTMDDNGTYECSVSLLSDLEGTSKSRVRLLVLVPPSKPDCGIIGETVIGNNINLTCRSAEGSPSPQYSWKSYNAQNQERPLTQPASGQPLLLKNITTEMAGYYVCTSSNEVGVESCNITVAPRQPSMNIALYAGIAGGVFAALIIIGIIVYCCCCRDKDEKAEDMEDVRPNRADYQKPQEQRREVSREREDKDDYRSEDRRSSGHSSLDQPFK